MEVKKSEMKPVLVTTEHRGVFFGYAKPDQPMDARSMPLAAARCAIYWSTTRGIAELAEVGPNSKSKIGAPADILCLHDITAVWSVSEEAVKKWEAA